MNESYLPTIHHAPGSPFIAYDGYFDATPWDLAPVPSDDQFVAYPSGLTIATNNDGTYFNPLGVY